jgi:protein-disulfide isomerase
MAAESGGSRVVAAIVVGVAFVIGAWIVGTAMDRQSEQIAAVASAVGNLDDAIRAGGGGGAPGRPRAEGPQMPDPNKRYNVDLGTAPARGGKDAKVTIVEFSDFQCPFCARVEPTLGQISQTYGDKVRVVFKHLPLRIHPDAPAAHAAAESAHRQGKFWEMHDKIFANQRELKPEKFREYAQQSGLDLAKYDKDVASPDVKKKIDSDSQEADKLGVSGTPAFFINGRYLSGAQPFEAFKKMIDEELAKG